MTEQPRRVIPPAASSSTPAPTKAQAPNKSYSAARDFPPLAQIFLGFLLTAVGGVLLIMDPVGVKAVGVATAILGQIFLLVGVIAQGVYIGTAKARDRGLL